MTVGVFDAGLTILSAKATHIYQANALVQLTDVYHP